MDCNLNVLSAIEKFKIEPMAICKKENGNKGNGNQGICKWGTLKLQVL